MSYLGLDIGTVINKCFEVIAEVNTKISDPVVSMSISSQGEAFKTIGKNSNNLMYISNMTHFLDETGSIPKQMPKEARELASFFTLVIDATTNEFPSAVTLTDIRCFKKRCDGMIRSELLSAKDEIHWICSKCQNEGRINGWQKTKWDNR